MFKNATKLTGDFLKNSFAFSLNMPSNQAQAKFDDYYANICTMIQRWHYLSPTMTQIEEYITNGTTKIGNDEWLVCPIADKQTRVDLFLAAQAKQLIYDVLGGRGAMLRAESGTGNFCPDTIDRLKMLGLYQRTFMCE